MRLANHTTLDGDISVAGIAETLGSSMVSVVAGHASLARPVRGSVLHDPADVLPDGVDAFLLVPGLRPEDDNASELLRHAAKRGYSAIAVKSHGASMDSLTAAANDCGIALLTAADDVPWRHLDSLLLSLLGSRGAGVGTTAAGDQLFALTNAVAAVVGGAVSVEDLDRKVLAYSSLPTQPIDRLRREGILSHRVPEIENNLERYRQLITSSGVMRFPAELGILPRAAVAMRAGNLPLGSIWAIEPPEGLSPDAEQALLDGARLAALQVLRRRDAEEVALQMRESALVGALLGTWSEPETARRLDVSTSAALTLVGFAARAGSAGSAVSPAHLASAVSRYIVTLRPDVGVAAIGQTVYVLLPSADTTSGSRLARGALSALAGTFGERIRSAVAQVGTSPAELPAMRREIDDILRVTTLDASLPAIAELSDVHTPVLVMRVSDELAGEPRLQDPRLVHMLEQDRQQGTEFARSLLAWFDEVGDVRAAALRLRIHPNTLRYRLRRVTEQFGVDLDRADSRLAVWMQLRALADGRVPTSP
jgi:hypothetical protein